MNAAVTPLPGSPSDGRAFGARGIFAAVLGNGFEFYDFGVYAAYAVMIGKVFFPSDSAFASLMASVATFGVGFISRPLGAMIIGAYGDRKGRKPAMMLTIGLMAVGSGLIGVLPGYATLGVLAPVLLVFGRLIQGFAAGGEMGPATMFMLESAPAHKRCFYGSWQLASQNLGSVFVGLTGFLLGHFLSPESLNGWGWRIPFLLGILIAPVGVYIRNQLKESAHDIQPEKSTGAVLAGVFGQHWRAILLAICITSGGTISQYFLLNMPTYAISQLHLPASVALGGMFTLGIVGTLGALGGGLLADRFGPKAIAMVPRVLLLLTVIPTVQWLVAGPSSFTYSVVLSYLALLQGASGAAMLILVPYLLPANVRATGLSVGYSLGVMIFGGTATPIFTWLVHRLNDPLAGVYYMIVANVLSVACMFAVSASALRSVNAADDRGEQALAVKRAQA